MMADELKPCPFCGGEVELRHDHTTEDIDTINHAQPAPDCPLDAGVSAFLIGNKELVAAWNRRPAPKADSGPGDNTDCGHPNPIWFADNELWNAVMGGPDATDDPGGVLCPSCFMLKAGETLRVSRPAPKADGLVEELREKADQVAAAKRNLHGLPILVTESDTQPGRSALWMDNGLAGCGQVAVSTGEFPCRQTDAVAALANVAASLDFQRILAALSDRDVVLEEAAKAAEDERYAQNVVDACYSEGNRLPETYNDACDDIARAIRAIKGGVDE